MVTEQLLLFFVACAGFYMAWSIGANDVANAMGTSVGSGALTLRQAVLIAAVLEFTGAFFFGSHVSETIQSGIVNGGQLFQGDWRLFVSGMLSALLAAAGWLQLASYYGWPVSTTHSIVGAVVGFGLIAGGWEAIYWDNIAMIFASWLLSPILGAVISFLLFSALRRTIFFAASPLREAQRWTPLLALVVTAMLLFFILEGTSAVDRLSSWSLFLVSGLAASSVALIVHLAMKRFIPASIAQRGDSSHHLATEIDAELAKVKKHLDRVHQMAKKEARYHASLLLDEVHYMRESLQRRTQPATGEYEAVEKIFAILQTLTACVMAFAHGANDVANAIGPLAAAHAAIVSHGVVLSAPIPSWALAMGGIGIVIGLATWGWRVIETIGKKITELTPSRGFSAEFGAATTILLASRLGLPISTTHTLVGAVLGVALARGLGALNLATMRDIILSWLVTVPVGALLAIAIYLPLHWLLIGCCASA